MGYCGGGITVLWYIVLFIYHQFFEEFWFDFLFSAQVMQDFKPGEERPLRATASTAEEAYRHSSFKVHDDE